MAKFKKIVPFILLVVVSIISLAACSSKSTKLTYYVDNKVYYEDTVSKTNEIKLPQDPKKEGYTFTGWVLKSDNKTKFNKNYKLKEDTQLVATFKPILVSRVIEGKEETVKLLNIDENLPTKDGLVLDKWYVDSEFKTLYTNQNVDKLYARFVTLVRFYNGHEVIKEQKVLPNNKIEKPKAEDIATYYMDKEGLEYFANETDEFDFTKPITTSITINVMWKTPYLKFAKNSTTGNYSIINIDDDTPEGRKFWYETKPSVVRLPSKYVTKDTEGNSVVNNVETVSGESFIGKTKKIIIDEGIKYIKNFISNSIFSFDEIILPESTKVISNSFNGFKNIKKINIPSSVEQIFNSFWADNKFDFDDSYKEYKDIIKLPKTIKGMSKVPTNFSIDGNNNWYRETKGNINYLYHKESDNTLTLISATTTGDTIEVPEGVNNIHVGFYSHNPNVKYIKFPSSFRKVVFNSNLTDYPYCDDGNLLDTSELPYGDQTKANGYSIIQALEKLEKVIFNQSEFPTDIHKNAIVGKNEDGETINYTEFEDKIVFIKKIEENNPVTVKVNIRNIDTNSKNENNDGNAYVFKDVYKSGDIIDVTKLLTDLKLNDSNIYKIIEYKQFNQNFDITKPIDSNVYLDVYYKLNPKGYKYTINSNNEAVITGFNKDNATLNPKTNLYSVIIPNEIDGKKVVEISNEAFKDVEEIEFVLIPSTVKVIGDKAFYGATNLKKVSIASGDLEVIGRSAFEKTGLTDIYLSLKNLKEVRPYAFKTPTLSEFKVAEGEEPLKLFDFSFANPHLVYPTEDLIGKFFLYRNLNNDDNNGYFQLFKFTGVDYITVKEKLDDKEPNFKLKVYDMQLVAVAGGYKSRSYNLGISMRSSSIPKYLPDGLIKTQLLNGAVRYEVMEGSVYYLENEEGVSTSLILGFVKKIHKNAFTDIRAKSSINGSANYKLLGEVYTNADGKKITNAIFRHIRGFDGESPYEEYITEEDLKNKSIFEEGFWEGLTGDRFDEFINGIQPSDNGPLY